MFSSPKEAMLLVKWILASLLLMYVSIGWWHFKCADQWISDSNHSRLKDGGNFKTIFSIADAAPILVILFSFIPAFYFNTNAVGFLALVASIGACFASVMILIFSYLHGVLRLIFLAFIALLAAGYFFLLPIGTQWLQSVMNRLLI